MSGDAIPGKKYAFTLVLALGLVAAAFGVHWLLKPAEPEWSSIEVAPKLPEQNQGLFRIRSFRVPTGSERYARDHLGVVDVWHTPNAGDTTRQGADVSLRPRDNLVLMEPTDERVFLGYVDSRTHHTGESWSFVGSVTTDQVLRVEVVNTLHVGYKDLQQIPYAKLKELARAPDHLYSFIANVVLCQIRTRTFQRVMTRSKIDDQAIKVGQDLFASVDSDSTEWHLIVSVLDFTKIDVDSGVFGDASQPTASPRDLPKSLTGLRAKTSPLDSRPPRTAPLDFEPLKATSDRQLYPWRVP